jgi:hypothetical protein
MRLSGTMDLKNVSTDGKERISTCIIAIVDVGAGTHQNVAARETVRVQPRDGGRCFVCHP